MLQPVNRLPQGVLSHIARHILQGSTDTYPIIPLTHVCRYWRHSIIPARENWTLVSSRRTDLMALTLERSKGAALQLRVDPYSTEFPSFCDQILPHIQRIETLRFWELETMEELTLALPNFPQSTPNLRVLELPSMAGLNASIDPFESFPDTLRSLSLDDIPLYPSFLKLRTLTKLSLKYCRKGCPDLDTLLDFLEENHSLESVDLTIGNSRFPAHIPHRRTAITNRLQHLSITFRYAMIARTLISGIPLRRGGHLEITFNDDYTGLGLDDIMSGVSMTHLPNLLSPTFMEYRSPDPTIRLIGPNGSFSYVHQWSPGVPFTEFSVLSLAKIRELRLTHNNPSAMFLPSSFPALETLTIKCDTDISRLFSTLFPNPSLFPSLKTLGFLGCFITEEFMDELAQFASDRKNTTSARLHRVVIVHLDGRVPTVASIHGLEEHVPIVDVRFGRTFPIDLT